MFLKNNSLNLFIASCFSVASIGTASDLTTDAKLLELSGGETTVFADGPTAFSMPAANTTHDHRTEFVVGNSLFNENWVAAPSSVKSRQGLGPTFNAQSCSACHFKDGRGAPPPKTTQPILSLLFRISYIDSAGRVQDVPGYGDQIQPKGIPGVPGEAKPLLSRAIKEGKYPDGQIYSLEVPSVTFEELAYGKLPKNLLISPRVAPAVIGMGLLENIKESDILALQDPSDANNDHISGRANQVFNVETGKTSLGRFGWKSNQPSVRQQNFSAFLGDMGITSKFKPTQNCVSGQTECLASFKIKTPELSTESENQVLTYTRLLAVPAARNTDKPAFSSGLKTFRTLECNSCHVESFTTGDNADFPELSHQKIRPYTDLLLHDMGNELADKRPDFLATGNEWRTPPLWGVGLFQVVNHHTRYLHDGRARSLEEAILWHGGEAEMCKTRFMESPLSARTDLIYFLENL